MKMSSLHKTQKDDDSESDDDEEDDNNLDEDAILEYRSSKHHGGVNRIRAQPLADGLPSISSPYYVASWSDTGKVHIWNIRHHLEALDTPGFKVDKGITDTPTFTIDSHRRSEGFAMDWAASTSGLRLLTGDINSNIYLTTSLPSSFKPFANPFTSHTSSIEDLQWSPSQPTVFASCSADQSIRIWDVREKSKRHRLVIEGAHSSDVNVISWNKIAHYLLVSGGDEGALKVWDLRQVKE
jgi:ribosome assembly protein RRB1